MRGWMLPFTGIAFAMAFLFTRPWSAAAGDLPGAGSDFLIDVWQSDDGLPQNSVIAMAQTADGYLWMSTYSGLARFDGRRFDAFVGAEIPELAGEIYFLSLRADGQGNLWMRGKQMLVAKDGHFRLVGPNDGLPRGQIVWETGPDGTLWVGDSNGRLLKEVQDHFVVVKDTPPTPDWGPLTTLQVGPSDDVWTWRHREYARFTRGQWSIVFHLTGKGDIGASKLSPDGKRLWITRNNPDSALLRYSDERLSDLGPLPSNFGTYFVLEDRAGDVWVPGQHSVFRYGTDGRWTELSVRDGFPMDEVRSGLVDREGNLWFGTDGGGVARVKRRAARSFGMAQGMDRKVALSVSADGTNSLWVAALGGRLNHFDGQRFTSFGDPNDLLWNVCPDRQGNLWMGTYSAGLFRKAAGKTNFKKFTAANTPGLVEGPIISLYESSHGDMWIGGGHGGVSRFANGQFQCWPKSSAFPADPINAMCEAGAGAMWIGAANGLDLFRDGVVKHYSPADGLAGGEVHALFRDSQGALWIGGYNLTRFKDGAFSAVRGSNGLPANNIQAIMEDNEGYLWLATQHGILRISVRKLNQFCDTREGRLEFSLFTKEDGLPSNECSGNEPSVWKDADGRLWFATLGGLAVIDPAHLPENKAPPPVAIESVVADDKSLALPGETGGPLRVPAGTSRLEFRFVALSFTAPEKNRFRYRLEGFDSDWSREEAAQTAAYTRLPPATYHFQVRACNNDGVWNEMGAILAVTVLPLFWQTGWFRALMVAVSAGLVFWVFRARLAQEERRRVAQESFARQVIETQEAERQRIASELHDGVGQLLLLVKNRLAIGLRKMEPSPFAQEHFGQASADVAKALEEIRATSHALRPVELDRLGLGQALESMLERAAETTTTRISTELEDFKNAVSREVEIQLYRIAQEAINNVLKHSKANEVNVSLTQEDGRLVLAVQDDGVGFESGTAARASGFGMSGMAERARLIGGELAVMAAPGKGCRLTVTVPLIKGKRE